tara:strand:+ start:9459 stop:10478 length:1020 start_codon:yes stop_codon:yes gene_type:complete
MKQTYSFDDVLLVPQYSDINSRSEVNTKCNLTNFDFSLPIISSPMDTITETDMATTLSNSGALGIIHRYNTIQKQAQLVVDARLQGCKNIGAAIGIAGDFLERAITVVDVGANILCIDVAHGHHSMMHKAINTLKDKFGDQVHIMAGNVATLEAFDALASWGADSVRVGIGGGSICSTRIVTGHGVPTLQSVMECAKSSYDTKIIADGGIKTSGDIVKALAAGADFVMIGSMLAGTDESPGDVRVKLNGEKYKEYRGMASKEAQRDWRGKSSTPEGVATMVPYRGSVADILADIEGGIRSGLSYTGARNISELQARAEFILQSSAAQLESNTHILWRNK